MEWVPKHLTRPQLEERRRAALRLLKAGQLSQAEIGRRLGVSRAAVGQWRQQLQQDRNSFSGYDSTIVGDQMAATDPPRQGSSTDDKWLSSWGQSLETSHLASTF